MELSLDTIQKLIDEKREKLWIKKKDVYDVRNWCKEQREYDEKIRKKEKSNHIFYYWNP